MQIDSWTTAQRDALISTAQGTIKVYVPMTNARLDFTPLRGAIVKINKIPLTEGINWTASVSSDATAVSLAAAITTATASTLCTASTDSIDKSLVIVRANGAGPTGNAIPISCFLPRYTFPSGATLTGGRAPGLGNLIFNLDTGKLEVLATASGADVLAAGVTWQSVVTA